MVLHGQFTTTKHLKVYAPSPLPRPLIFFFYFSDFLSLSLFSFLPYIHIIHIIYIYYTFLKTLLVYIVFVCCFRNMGGGEGREGNPSLSLSLCSRASTLPIVVVDQVDWCPQSNPLSCVCVSLSHSLLLCPSPSHPPPPPPLPPPSH